MLCRYGLEKAAHLTTVKKAWQFYFRAPLGGELFEQTLSFLHCWPRLCARVSLMQPQG